MPATLRRMTVLACALVALLARTDARAQDHIPVDDMGKFLGHTVLCGCLAQEPDHLMALYYALLVEWEDESYAGSASGYMELARDGDYRNKATFCSIICDHEFTTYLTDVVSMIDMDSEPKSFVMNYNSYRVEHGGQGNGDHSDFADSGSHAQSASEETLPECNATEDLYPGIGCEGHRRSRINGY